ncbi:alanine racemase [Ruminococcus albus]|uniref:Orn/DAP/Arg decarboxylase 2 n=1 Tax=Ruminococcus albus (strain ATCC 27210 / DSM 20455 / JCM 14654 / NCDO 2250 / 7) TaxID=697329 RepID=E6UC14_RUMA7|nr:alanine racemase [Ruminococcus albus]ADU21565.1 Orn/DAP/Arg decarboxylase 2 [Ruminococcus albus 7 = DSM 20455]
MEKEILKNAALTLGTPCYIFDTDVFAKRAAAVKNAFGDRVGLCYSIKANPFLLAALPEEFSYIEVCSPGELSICENVGAPLDKIIFSGVNKTGEDIARAYADGVAIFTAESRLHAELINECAVKNGGRVKLILRLAHGSQFGMDKSDLLDIIDRREQFAGVEIIGLHYFTGTQKTKVKTIEKELALLDELCAELENEHGYKPSHIEYGTGLAVEYYKDFTESTDIALLEEASAVIRPFAEKYPLTVEMGRFFAAECGSYLTKIMDIKTTNDLKYVICDGGINHVNYYGQNMAMKVPPIEVIEKTGEEKDYCLCGSLCTTADILVRKATLPTLERGDIIAFSKCGAYSVAEGIAAFLSRDMPAVALFSEKDGLVSQRGHVATHPLNTPSEVRP